MPEPEAKNQLWIIRYKYASRRGFHGEQGIGMLFALEFELETRAAHVMKCDLSVFFTRKGKLKVRNI